MKSGTQNVEETLEQEFKILQKYMELVHEKCNSEKAELLGKLESIKNSESDVKQDADALEERLGKNTITTYAIQEINKWKEEVAKMKKEAITLEQDRFAQTESYLKEIIFLQLKMQLKEKSSINSIGMVHFKQVQESLNEQVMKYRKLLAEFEEQNEFRSLQIETLKQTEEDVLKENAELKGIIEKHIVLSNAFSYVSSLPNSSFITHHEDLKNYKRYSIDLKQHKKFRFLFKKLKLMMVQQK